MQGRDAVIRTMKEQRIWCGETWTVCSSAGRMEGQGVVRCTVIMCYVVSLLGFPFLKVSPVPSPSLSLAGECVCRSNCEKLLCVVWMCVCVCVAKLGLVKNQRNGTQDEPGDKLTTQLPETLRHMPDLQVKIKITQEQSPASTIVFT